MLATRPTWGEIAGMRQSRSLSLLVSTLMVLLPRSGYGVEYATAQLSIGGTHADNCVPADELVAAVETRLERHPFVTHPSPDLFVHIDFTRVGNQWSARIDMRSITGQSLGGRSIESQARDCSEMNDSLALVLALMIDLTRKEVESKTPARKPEDSTEVLVPSDAAELRTWSQVLTASLLSTVGQLPSIGWGGRVATQLRHRSGISAELGVAAVVPSTWNDDRGAHASFNWFAADIGVCAGLLGRGRSELAVCAGSQVSFERAEGSGYRVSHVQSVTSPLPFIKLESNYELVRSLGFHLAFAALAPLVRDRFYATRADGAETTIHSTSPIVAQLEAGLSLGF
ncbi:MAG TPA: hypothetical protein VIV60_02225 [Polyangiaceae bacterium]